jgi:hypothetical protein|tara:strand:- start:562 stop:819 length:258 start_codon:yes stop_codon:yes gene_type:complete
MPNRVGALIQQMLKKLEASGLIDSRSLLTSEVPNRLSKITCVLLLSLESTACRLRGAWVYGAHITGWPLISLQEDNMIFGKIQET